MLATGWCSAPDSRLLSVPTSWVYYWETVFPLRLALWSGAILSRCSFPSASLPYEKEIAMYGEHGGLHVGGGGRWSREEEEKNIHPKNQHKVLRALHRDVKKQWSWPKPTTQGKTDGLPESIESETGHGRDFLWRYLVLRLNHEYSSSPKAFKKITNEGEGNIGLQCSKYYSEERVNWQK